MPRVTRKDGFGKRGRKVETRIARVEKKDLPAGGGSSGWAFTTHKAFEDAYLVGGGTHALMRLSPDDFEHSGGFSLVQHPTHTDDTGFVHGIDVPEEGFYEIEFAFSGAVTTNTTFTGLYLNQEIEVDNWYDDRRLAWAGSAVDNLDHWASQSLVTWVTPSTPVFFWLIRESIGSLVYFTEVSVQEQTRVAIRRWDG